MAPGEVTRIDGPCSLPPREKWRTARLARANCQTESTRAHRSRTLRGLHKPVVRVFTSGIWCSLPTRMRRLGELGALPLQPIVIPRGEFWRRLAGVCRDRWAAAGGSSDGRLAAIGGGGLWRWGRQHRSYADGSDPCARPRGNGTPAEALAPNIFARPSAVEQDAQCEPDPNHCSSCRASKIVPAALLGAPMAAVVSACDWGPTANVTAPSEPPAARAVPPWASTQLTAQPEMRSGVQNGRAVTEFGRCPLRCDRRSRARRCTVQP
jgi:hypothetical protein